MEHGLVSGVWCMVWSGSEQEVKHQGRITVVSRTTVLPCVWHMGVVPNKDCNVCNQLDFFLRVCGRGLSANVA